MLIKLIQAKLRTAHCRNQGFVLDGFPKDMEQAKLLWAADDEAAEATEGITQGHGIPVNLTGLDPVLTPTYVVVMEVIAVMTSS